MRCLAFGGSSDARKGLRLDMSVVWCGLSRGRSPAWKSCSAYPVHSFRQSQIFSVNHKKTGDKRSKFLKIECRWWINLQNLVDMDIVSVDRPSRSTIHFKSHSIKGFSNDQSNCRFLHEGKSFCPSGKSLGGVIGYLTAKCGGNVHDQGLIAVTSSSICGSHRPKNATDLRVSSRITNRIRGSAMISRRWKLR
jgi:hypothetical protein